MARILKLAGLATLLGFAACTGGSGNSDEYYAPGYNIAPPEIVATPNSRGELTPMDSYAFGQVSSTASTLLTLNNVGELPASITNISFANSAFSFSGGNFPGTGGTCTQSIPANGSCTISVSFTPSAGSSISAALSVTYRTRGGERTLSVLFTGSGPSQSQNSDAGSDEVTYPPPTLTSIDISAGTISGGTVIALTGTGFRSGATATFGGTACTGLSVDSATAISCTTPAHSAGAVDIIVTNTDNQTATLSNGYTYQPAPTVISISPNAGALTGGTVVTLTGTGFRNGAQVDFGGSNCSLVNVASDTEITCTTSAHAAGAVLVTVTNSDFQLGTKAAAYTYRAAPAVTSLSPNAGALAGGTSVTLTGTGFVDGATVTFDGVPATSVTVISATQITCVTPNHAAGAVDVTVTNADLQSGTKSSGYTYQAAPTVTSLSPDAGALAGGTTVTITGTHFLAGATVTFGGASATSVSVDSATQITCVTPNHAAGIVDVVVTNADTQSGEKTSGYTYQPAPTITASTPATGTTAGGTSVTITGTGFISGASVTYGGSACTSVSVANANTITCTTPAHAAGDVDVIVTNTDNQSATGSAAYTYQASPTVLSVSPSSGSILGGTVLTITGTGFVNGAFVSLSGAFACPAAIVDSATQIRCTTDAHSAGVVDVTVTNANLDSGTGVGLYTFIDPSVGNWTSTTTSGAPTGRRWATSVWTGSHAIIWGGSDGQSVFANGKKYDPITDTWTAVTTTGQPSARYQHSALWTGSKMFIWGGSGGGQSGGLYDPAADTWSPVSAVDAPPGGDYASAVWTGAKAIVWGGGWSSPTNLGGMYDPQTNTWTPTSGGSPSARCLHQAVWTGGKMIVWGGYNGGGLNTGGLNTGGIFDPNLNSWQSMTTTGAPEGRAEFTAEWTGSKMIVWGGGDLASNTYNTGGMYDPATDTWTATSTSNAPSARRYHTSVWTGSRMIIWGGLGVTNTGGVFDPITNTWQTTTLTGAPAARYVHTAVWTGAKMLVWGGYSSSFVDINTGGLYTPPADPASNTWVATSTTGAPDERFLNSALWTGSKMLVWGGSDGSTFFNTGGLYDPITDSWTATTVAGAPNGRVYHSAVWTGSKMMVWGGRSNSMGSNDNTGSKYDPVLDSWSAITTTGAPSGREEHVGFWTGGKMLIWGGNVNNSTGGSYNPDTNTWTSLSVTNAPSGRQWMSAAWTGAKMIVWGGYGLSEVSYVNTGGIYDPSSDTWTTMTTTNAPNPRANARAIWSGSKFIIWGGMDPGNDTLGGTYSPETDTWTTMSTTNAANTIQSHSFAMVWTGSKVLIFSGGNNVSFYAPDTDTWSTATMGSPASFGTSASFVWTGSKLIHFGGGSAPYSKTGGIYTP